MVDPRLSGGSGGGVRRWRFADCEFDESNWALTVGGHRAVIESKPLEILRQLLLQPDRVVSKGELLDAIWPDLAVVEASLPTAVRKLRVALGDERREQPIVETVSRIGYRLAVPVTRADAHDPSERSTSAPRHDQPPAFARSEYRSAAMLLLGGASLVLMIGLGGTAPGSPDLAHPSPTQVIRAIHALDVEKVQAFIDAGWKVDSPLTSQGDFAFGTLAEICEWNPGHDRARMLQLGRTLFDGGHDPTHRNVYGDTSYSIAKADRYCGPNHPLTVMLRNMCYRGPNAQRLGDRCLASYELARRALAAKKGAADGAAPSLLSAGG